MWFKAHEQDLATGLDILPEWYVEAQQVAIKIAVREMFCG